MCFSALTAATILVSILGFAVVERLVNDQHVQIQERLLNSQKSFDGLLSLIPAKMYYGEDATVCELKLLLPPTSLSLSLFLSIGMIYP